MSPILYLNNKQEYAAFYLIRAINHKNELLFHRLFVKDELNRSLNSAIGDYNRIANES